MVLFMILWIVTLVYFNRKYISKICRRKRHINLNQSENIGFETVHLTNSDIETHV